MSSFEEIFFQNVFDHILVKIIDHLSLNDIYQLLAVNKAMKAKFKVIPKLRSLAQFCIFATKRLCVLSDPLRTCRLACEMNYLEVVKHQWKFLSLSSRNVKRNQQRWARVTNDVGVVFKLIFHLQRQRRSMPDNSCSCCWP